SSKHWYGNTMSTCQRPRERCISCSTTWLPSDSLKRHLHEVRGAPSQLCSDCMHRHAHCLLEHVDSSRHSQCADFRVRVRCDRVVATLSVSQRQLDSDHERR